MHRFLLRAALPAALLLTTLSAQAAFIEIVPSKAEVHVGETVSIDIVANELNLGAFDLTLQFAPALVGLTGEPTFFGFLGGPDSSFFGSLPGLDNVNLAEVSFLTDPNDLLGLQGTQSFKLATLQFSALSAGIAQFAFSSAMLSDIDTATPVSADLLTASVVIRSVDPGPGPEPSPVPEPGTFLLLAASGILFFPYLRRR